MTYPFPDLTNQGQPFPGFGAGANITGIPTINAGAFLNAAYPDNSAAMALLMAFCPAAGALVYVPPGTYYFGSKITVTKPIKFDSFAQAGGDNPATVGPVEFVYNGASQIAGFIEFTNGGGTSQVRGGGISGITITGNANAYHGVRLTDRVETDVTDNFIRHFTRTGILCDNRFATANPEGYSYITRNRIVGHQQSWSARMSGIQFMGRTNAITDATGIHRMHPSDNIIQIKDGYGIVWDSGDGFRAMNNNVSVYGAGFGICMRGWTRFLMDGVTAAWDDVNGIWVAGAIWQPDLYDNSTLFSNAAQNVRPENYALINGNISSDPAIAGQFFEPVVGYYGAGGFASPSRSFYIPYNLGYRGCDFYCYQYPTGDNQALPSGRGARDMSIKWNYGDQLRRIGQIAGVDIDPTYFVPGIYQSRPGFRAARDQSNVGWTDADYSLRINQAGDLELYNNLTTTQLYRVKATGNQFYSTAGTFRATNATGDSEFQTECGAGFTANFVWRENGVTRNKLGFNGGFLTFFSFSNVGAFLGQCAQIDSNNNSWLFNNPPQFPKYTYAQLNALAYKITGMKAMCTDATTTNFGTSPVGGGAILVPVYYDGAWKIG